MIPKRLGAQLVAEFLGTLVLILFGNGGGGDRRFVRREARLRH